MKEAIYHCSTVKTASQWFKAFFSDKRVEEATGFKCVRYRDIRHKAVAEEKVFVTDMYTDYESFEEKVVKPDNYRYFFVLRDPRDVVVSWYYSVKHSHRLMGEIGDWRQHLQSLEKEEGLKWSIDKLIEQNYFEKQKSWVANRSEKIFRYEQLASDLYSFIIALLTHIGLLHHFDTATLEDLINIYSFKQMTGGRRQGQEKLESTMRKGVAGDYKNHFNKEIADYFRQRTNNVHKQLGYK